MTSNDVKSIGISFVLPHHLHVMKKTYTTCPSLSWVLKSDFLVMGTLWLQIHGNASNLDLFNLGHQLS